MRNKILEIDGFHHVKSAYIIDSRKWGCVEPKLAKIGPVLSYIFQSLTCNLKYSNIFPTKTLEWSNKTIY